MSVFVGCDSLSAVSVQRFVLVFTCTTAAGKFTFVVAAHTALGHTALGTPEDNTGWLSHGWRQARPTNPADPWALPSVMESGMEQSASPWNILLGGSVGVFDLELMGARTYDPATHSFLSIDPLPSTLGTPYTHNPYEYAGNNPLTLLDPLGLHPVTDKQINQYAQTIQQSHWEYLAAGAMVVAGVALMFTGVGGAAGIALMGASGAMLGGGISVATQKYGTGSVDWGAVGKDALIGGVTGLIGGAGFVAGKAAMQAGVKSGQVVRGIATSAGANGLAGGTSGIVTTLYQKGGDVTAKDILGGFLGGSLSGAAGGLAGPTAGTLTDNPTLRNAAAYGLDMGGNFIGESTNSYISTGSVNLRDSVTAAGSAGLGRTIETALPNSYRMHGADNSLQQMGVGHPRSLDVFNPLAEHGSNTQALWKGTVAGELIGIGTDEVVDRSVDYVSDLVK